MRALKRKAALIERARVRRPEPDPPKTIPTFFDIGIGERLRILRLMVTRTYHDIETGCWNWTGARTPKGYGRIKINGKLELLHRAVYIAVYGALPVDSGSVVMHTCDNPSCINPKHLQHGTRSDNMRDCSAKGRLYRRQPGDSR